MVHTFVIVVNKHTGFTLGLMQGGLKLPNVGALPRVELSFQIPFIDHMVKFTCYYNNTCMQSRHAHLFY